MVRDEGGPRQAGVGTTETPRKWVRHDQIDNDARPGATAEESGQVKAMKKEIAELERVNEILKAAANFFAAELDRTRTLVAFIDEHRTRFGGCRADLQDAHRHGCQIALSTCYAAKKGQLAPSARSVRD